VVRNNTQAAVCVDLATLPLKTGVWLMVMLLWWHVECDPYACLNIATIENTPHAHSNYSDCAIKGESQHVEKYATDTTA